MNIHYGVLIPQPPDAQNVHWLVTLAEGLRYAMEAHDEWISIKLDSTVTWRTYVMRAMRSKTSATLHGEGHAIHVSIGHQDNVNPLVITQPPSTKTIGASFSMDNAGMRQAVDFLKTHFEAPTMYSLGQNKQIQLCTLPSLHLNPPVFFGGLVEKVDLDQESWMDGDLNSNQQASRLVNGLFTVKDASRTRQVRVRQAPSFFHPKRYREGSKGVASRASGEYFETLYHFSREAIGVYYRLM